MFSPESLGEGAEHAACSMDLSIRKRPARIFSANNAVIASPALCAALPNANLFKQRDPRIMDDAAIPVETG